MFDNIKSRRDFQLYKVGILIGLGFLFYQFFANELFQQNYFTVRDEIVNDRCPVYDYARPKTYLESNSTLIKIISDEGFRNQSAAKLSGAVQIKTDVYDESPSVESDPEYWERKFRPFHQYLEDTFPKIWKDFLIEKVNGWGLVITWAGSDPNLKPLLLTAHQDVVPIQESTLKDWKYPPYDGVYDGERLWGRGSADCKNLLVGLLEATDELLNDGFRPRRTVIFGFGFDEETGGARGAHYIGEHITQKYGNNSLYAIIDEGGQSLTEENDVLLSLPGTSEKGAVDVVIGLFTPGGHSSVPPDKTSIGIISELIERIEENPFKGIFTPKNPTFHEYQCIAVHSPTIDREVRTSILRAQFDKKSNERSIKFLSEKSLLSRYLISTSQAVDIIKGGVKSNALPEHVEVLINHRVAIESSVAETVNSDLQHVLFIAETFDLGVVFEDQTIREASGKGYFTINQVSELEPAPTTPTNDTHWRLLAGTIRHVYEEIAFADPKSVYHGRKVVVAPGIATGNTDTKHYWNLSEHIYRYRPGITPTVETHAHGVNENLPIDSHLQLIAFYYEYVQLVDALTH